MMEKIKNWIFGSFTPGRPARDEPAASLGTPGAGTIFDAYQPWIADTKIVPGTITKRLPLGRGSETVLVVEDETKLRALTTYILEKEGYTVLSAKNGLEAVRLIKARTKDAFDLVLIDMVMPVMSGEELAEAVGESNPTLKILFTSAYTSGEIPEDEGVRRQFLPKPFTPLALVRKVREVIDGPDMPVIRTAA
jgi:CheY-like chemotaxis protein